MVQIYNDVAEDLEKMSKRKELLTRRVTNSVLELLKKKEGIYEARAFLTSQNGHVTAWQRLFLQLKACECESIRQLRRKDCIPYEAASLNKT